MADLPSRPPEWIPTAPVVVRCTRPIAASTDAVWALIADHETWPVWFESLTTVRVTGEAAGVGGRREVTLGRVTVGEVFTAWEPGERFAFAVVSAPRLFAAIAESVELAPNGTDACTVTYSQGIDPARGFGWVARLVSTRLERELGKALDALAMRAEGASR